jgi:hypothetical protein
LSAASSRHVPASSLRWLRRKGATSLKKPAAQGRRLGLATSVQFLNHRSHPQPRLCTSTRPTSSVPGTTLGYTCIFMMSV